MNIAKCVRDLSTLTELKRIAGPYVIDYRALTEEEIKDALIKTAPQYYYESNVAAALSKIKLHANRNIRIIGPHILQNIVLQRDEYISPKRATDEDIIKWEQGIVDRSNEDILKKTNERTRDLEFMKFVMEAAWDHNDDLSIDEKNLIEKIRERILVTPTELRIIEAQLGKFPKEENEIHTRQEIEEVRRELQASGLLFAIRDNDGTDFDVIPSEIAATISKVLGIEMRDYGYSELLKYKAVRSKTYIKSALDKVGIKTEKNPTLEELSSIALEQLSPRVLLGGTSPRDGLPLGIMNKWCSELGLNVSGTKTELIERIIGFYNDLHEKSDEVTDEREVLLKYFEDFANRNIKGLRSQQLIDKDIEIERKFEEVTNYIFEKMLGHKPLKLVGTNHADGALSHKDRIIYWDNKSKESPVNLKDHIRQFDGYIKQSEKEVSGFLVIGPDFTPESSLIAMQYQVENGTMISMITATELKTLAESWAAKKDAGAFPLGYLLQSGRFNPALVAAII